MEPLTIDTKKIEELKELVDEDDPGFLIELLEDYMNDSKENLKAIRYAIQAKDAVTVVKTAHKLKGASSLELRFFCVMNPGACVTKQEQRLSQELSKFLLKRAMRNCDLVPFIFFINYSNF